MALLPNPRTGLWGGMGAPPVPPPPQFWSGLGAPPVPSIPAATYQPQVAAPVTSAIPVTPDVLPALPPASSPTSTPSLPALPSLPDILRNDVAFGLFNANLSAQGIADAANRAAARQRALIGFGEVPATLDQAIVGPDLATDITQTTRDLAAQNTSAGLSTLARLNQAHADAVRTITNALAARGILHSGETGFQLGREQTAYTANQYDARQKLLDYLGGVQAAFVQAERQRQQALYQAQLNALSMWLQTHPYISSGDTGPGSAVPGTGLPTTPTSAPNPVFFNPDVSPAYLGGAQARYRAITGQPYVGGPQA